MSQPCDATLSKYGYSIRCSRRGRKNVGGYWLCHTHAVTYDEYKELGGTESARLRIEEGITMAQQLAEGEHAYA